MIMLSLLCAIDMYIVVAYPNLGSNPLLGRVSSETFTFEKSWRVKVLWGAYGKLRIEVKL
jgi:hypothetical protein